MKDNLVNAFKVLSLLSFVWILLSASIAVTLLIIHFLGVIGLALFVFFVVFFIFNV